MKASAAFTDCYLSEQHVIDIFCSTDVFNEIRVTGSDFSKINFFYTK